MKKEHAEKIAVLSRQHGVKIAQTIDTTARANKVPVQPFLYGVGIQLVAVCIIGMEKGQRKHLLDGLPKAVKEMESIMLEVVSLKSGECYGAN